MTNIEYLKKYYKGNIEDALKRLEAGEPVQYIVGNVDFYGYTYDINKNVLIPRFETEELVSKLIDYIKKYYNTSVDILDIGTGSGCIANTLAMELPSSVTAVDISKEALEVAKQNGCKYKTNVKFVLSDLYTNINDKFDVIVSNPPYIRYDEKIMDIVKNNEPHLALYANDNGLYFYKKILDDASKYLKDKFIIAFEIGSEQGKDISLYASNLFDEASIKIEKDMQGLDRFVFIIKM